MNQEIWGVWIVRKQNYGWVGRCICGWESYSTLSKDRAQFYTWAHHMLHLGEKEITNAQEDYYI